MNLTVNFIPLSWDPGNPEAIQKWIERIAHYDLNKSIKQPNQ